MAAMSARLASMGFMKRAQAAKGQQSSSTEEQQPAAAPTAAAPPQPPASLRQQQQQQSGGRKRHPADDSSHISGRQQQQPPHLQPQQQQQQQQQGDDPSSHQQQPAKKKYKLSDSISSMKFMQRAQLKRSREQAFDDKEDQEQQAARDAAEWTAATAVQDRGCLILHERDPLPAGVSGRMSFGFGQAFEQQQAEAAERAAAEEAAAQEASIKERDMAGCGFGKGWAGLMRGDASGAKGHASKRQRRH